MGYFCALAIVIYHSSFGNGPRAAAMSRPSSSPFDLIVVCTTNTRPGPPRPYVCATVILDITTGGEGVPSPAGLVGSEPIASTTDCPETTLPTRA